MDLGFWEMRRVLVTGACGLMGKWLTRRLADEGAHVVGMDLDWSGWDALDPEERVVRVQGDVRSGEDVLRLIRDEGIDTVLHLAAQSLVGLAAEGPVATFEHNVGGTWAVLEACRGAEQVTSLVVTSSVHVYGDASGEPYVETMPLKPPHPYAASKACADILARTYAETYGTPVAVTRCPNTYGGGDLLWSRLVPKTIKLISEGRPPVIRSGGDHVRDFLYVKDAVSAVLTLARSLVEVPETRGQAFNFSGGEQLTVLELMRRILRLMESDLEPHTRNLPSNEVAQERVSAEKARDVLGWSPGHTLDDGLSETVAWYGRHLSPGG